MAGFTDKLKTFGDDGNGGLTVSSNGLTETIDASVIDQFIANSVDATLHEAFNLAVRVSLGLGITSIKNADGSIRSDVLSLLNSLSFKSYSI